MRRASLLAVPVLIALIGSIAAAAPDQPEARATAVPVRIVQPGVPEQIALSVTAPPSAEQVLPGYAYPEDGTVVKIGSADAQVVAQPGTSSSAQANSGALAVSLFAGEITVASLDLRASVAAGTVSASGNVSASSITGLTVLGQLVTAAPNLFVPLADWGTLEVLGSQVETTQKPPRSAKASRHGASRQADRRPRWPGRRQRDRDRSGHGKRHGGTDNGRADQADDPGPDDAVSQAGDPARCSPRARHVDPGWRARRAHSPRSGRRRRSSRRAATSSPSSVPPRSATRSVLPRADVSGGWHHGEDIFAPLGTPLLAVADGTVFSVGWNDIGGWRVWLRDRAGNEFYYAHLSAYSPLAVNGRQVKAGDVIGFMGKTGDAEFSPVHLHFEIHPVSLLAMGYDGAVAPYPFLTAWRRAEDVSFDAGRAYLPLDGPAAARQGVAPPAGVVLLEADDISSTSGLVPGAIESTLTGRAPKSPAGGQDR